MDLDGLERRFDGPIEPALLVAAGQGAARHAAVLALARRRVALDQRILAARLRWRADEGGRGLGPAAVAAAIAAARADLAASRRHLARILAAGHHCS
ncbi:hypothetical protein [Phaeospirillum tilakii]|uniref:DUF222 domain-containing protein n=1 Tax=Phaeospirillum tilakii TaxID=741673 RepID=A0ABW5CB49_9PROT